MTDTIQTYTATVENDDIRQAWGWDSFINFNFVAASSGRVMSSLAGAGGLAGPGGMAGQGGGLAA